MLSLSVLLLLLLVVLSLCRAKELTGKEYFAKGVQLVQDDNLDEAAMHFWGSILNYQPEYPYKPDDAMNNFLLCYQKQNKLGLGYAFVAANMLKAKDGRARSYIKLAYENDPTNKEILQLLEAIGETEESIQNDRVYSPEPSEGIREINTKPHSCKTRKECRSFVDEPDKRTLEPGWEDIVQRDFVHAKARLINLPQIKVKIPPVDTFEVAYDKFWTRFQNGTVDWEQDTFNTFLNYVTKETIVVDIGAWYGPTSLFSAHLGKEVFSLEPDPVAYATLRHNLQLNPTLNVNVHAIAVVAPQDAGYVTLETRKKGNSESMIVPDKGPDKDGFEAAGYSLPFLLTLWGIELHKQPVFIKIDIEAYECRLLPSLHEFLVEEEKLPFLFVSFHPQIRPCSKQQMIGVFQTFTLFSGVSCNGKTLPIDSEKTTFAEFEGMLDDAACLTSKSNSDFMLTP